MFDGIKLLDLSVSADTLLQHDRLLFPLALDERTAAVLDRPRRATDQGLTFTLTPTLAGDRVRCELQGSLHRYGRGGLHNADDFTVADLLAVLDQLVTTYGIDPFTSRLNNVEFGVNVELPFSVGHVLDNLIMYKYRPFVRESGDGRADGRFSYYQAVTQRYIVKLYDKGHQYGLAAQVLRVEVKVLKMEYLTRHGIHLNALADLLTVANYGALGALLFDTFTGILFDEPTINPAALTVRERDVYQNGRNPRFWSIPDSVTGKEYDRYQKSLKRAETKFRMLLDQHRAGLDWQSLTAALIGQTWERLSTTDDDLLTRIGERRTVWGNLVKRNVQALVESEKCPLLTGLSGRDAGRETVEKCPKLTGSDSEPRKGEMSDINPLSVVLISDNGRSQESVPNGGRGTLPAAPVLKEKHCSAEGPPASALSPSTSGREGNQTTRRGFARPTASVLRADAELLARVEQNRKRYAKGSKEDQPGRAAHNLRNDESNPRNNLARRLRRLTVTPGLFAPSEVVRLTDDQRAALDHWRGTRYEIRL